MFSRGPKSAGELFGQDRGPRLTQRGVGDEPEIRLGVDTVEDAGLFDHR